MNVLLVVWPFVPIVCLSPVFWVPQHWETGGLIYLLFFVSPIWHLAGIGLATYTYYVGHGTVTRTCSRIGILGNILGLSFMFWLMK